MQQPEISIHPLIGRLHSNSQRAGVILYLTALLFGAYLANRQRFGASSEKYADGYEQMDLFNEAEANADTDAAAIEEEIVIPSHKRKKRTDKKEEDLSNFEVTETIEYKLTGEDRYCPDCGTKYKVVTKEVVKRLKFIPSTFEVVEEVTYVYSCLLYTSPSPRDS